MWLTEAMNDFIETLSLPVQLLIPLLLDHESYQQCIDNICSSNCSTVWKMTVYSRRLILSWYY